MNNSFLKLYDEYEIFKYQFENGFNTNKSYIRRSDSYYADNAFTLHCCECNEVYDVKELQFMNQKIICKCGAKFSTDDLKPGTRVWSLDHTTHTEHNIMNNTLKRVSVPTLIAKEKFYCPKCRTTHKLKDMPIENKKRVCTCGESYSFEECKLSDAEDYNYVSGKVFFDGHKITISAIMYYSSVNAHNIYYWQDGQERLTMNLETGFSYTSQTGICYTNTNRFYKEKYGKNAPKMFNSTYSCISNHTLETVIRAKYNELLYKYKDNKNLFKLMLKRQHKFQIIIFEKLFKQIDEYMTAYYNNKYSYRIKSLMELTREYKLSRSNTEVLLDSYRTTEKVDKENYPSMYDSNLFVLHNRFLNVSFKELKYVTTDLLLEMRTLSSKRNYKILPRETNNIGLDFICGNVNVSKKLRKKISAYLNDLLKVQRFNHLEEKIYTFINIAKFFKNKENVNKVYDTIMNGYGHGFRFDTQEDTMKLWLSYRNEQYISNCNYKELHDKAALMDDARRSIASIKQVLGEDWDLNTVKFYTEQQFHDDLVRITTSDDFIELVNKEKAEKALIPFEMEEEVFELQEEENDFYIARNRAILTNIGQAMGICVGGYGGSVESGHCRIAYLKENGIYKVCLELTKQKNKQTNKMEYTIVQAKMQYNKLVAENQEYYNKVVDWATRNNITIDTHDMVVQNKQNQANVIEF